MSWVKLDDKFATHPKIVGLTDGAFACHVRALCYSGQTQTDGFIPAGAVRLCTDDPANVTALVDAYLWEEAEGGWLIHDFLEYNPSRRENEELAAKRAAAGKRGAAARWGDSKGDSKSHSKPIANECPEPDPVPLVTSPNLQLGIRPDALEILVVADFDKAIAEGTAVRNVDAYKAKIRKRLSEEFDSKIARLDEAFPGAPADMIAGECLGQQTRIRDYAPPMDVTYDPEELAAS